MVKNFILSNVLEQSQLLAHLIFSKYIFLDREKQRSIYFTFNITVLTV